MKAGFRQSMAWLHTWTGLLFGWLLFAIFLTGTIAYFRNEVTHWMQPELHQAGPAPSRAEAAELGLRRLAELAPGAESWQLSLPDARNRTLDLSWRRPGDPRRGRGGPGVSLDPATGETLHPRETAGGNFLYRFHFELYGLPRKLAHWIVGIATMSMFVAIISGVITHKKIFKDFFTFRPGKGQRSWLDMHNMTAVLALPYHVMITFSGLVLFMAVMVPFVFDGGPRRGPPPPAVAEAEGGGASLSADLAAVAPLLRQAEERWAVPVGRIAVEGLRTGRPDIVLAPQRNRRLAVSSGSGSAGVERMRFDGMTGDLIEATEGREVSAVGAVNNVLGSLHRARFADTGLRWLFFVSGLAGTIMVGTGLMLWVSKRAAKHAKAGRLPVGFLLVERLNTGAIAGLVLATGGYFWANRLIPATLDGRANDEIAAFFAVWGAALIYPFLRGPARAWTEELWLAAVLLLALPFLNPATGGGNLIGTVWRGDWLAAGVDLAALVGGLACALAARSARGGRSAGSRRAPRPTATRAGQALAGE